MENKIEIDADQLPFIREKLMKCKVIALESMDKHPLMNPKYFSTREKDKLLKKTREIFDTKTLEEINELFTDICNDRLFNEGADYSNYPTYIDKRFPDQQEKIDREEPELEKLKEEIKTNKLIVQDIAGNYLEIEKSNV